MTSLLALDSMAINRVNPYTSTGTFGISSNGGYKTLQPTIRIENEVNAPLDKDTGVPVEHFNSLALNHAGNMYLGTGSSHPARTFMYPARKYEFDDGSTSFGRQIVLGKTENYVTSLYQDEQKGQLVLFFMVILLVFLLFLKPFNFR
jgi:hypothetical protein